MISIVVIIAEEVFESFPNDTSNCDTPKLAKIVGSPNEIDSLVLRLLVTYMLLVSPLSILYIALL